MKEVKNKLQDSIDNIIELRNSGMMQKDIAKLYNTSTSSIGRILRANGQVTRKELTKEDVEEIISLYTINEMSLADIGIKFHKTGKSIAAILKDNNIKITYSTGKNKNQKIHEKKPKIITEEIKMYIDEFNNGMSICDIARKYDKTESYIHYRIKNYVTLRERKKLSEKDELNIIDLYNSGMSSVKIGDKYNVRYIHIVNILEKYGIKRDYKSNRQYALNEHYFDEIDTPEKAYILGFFYADGCNYKPKQTISMSLQEEDFYILERMRQEIKSEKPLEFIDYSDKHDFGYNYKNQYRLLLFSAHMCSTLERYGMVPAKSLVLEFPNIDESLYRHFIRGYFDGDGCICLNGNVSFSITSTKNFCEKVNQILSKTLNIKHGSINEASCKNGITYVLGFTGIDRIKTIMDWMYEGTDFYLMRKYNKYISKFYS